MQWEEEKLKCPACGAVASDGALECAGCGVVFAKWKKKLERELPPSERSLDAPPPVLVREPDHSSSLPAKAAGGVLLIVAACLTGWLLSGGSSRPGVAGATVDAAHGYSIAVPEGWRERAGAPCGDEPGGCTIKFYERGEASKERLAEWIELRIIPRASANKSGAPAIEETLREQIRAGIGEGTVSEGKRAILDGVTGYRVEGRGRKHFRVQTAEAVVTNSQAALAEQQRQNPNKGVYTVMGTYNPRSMNLAVTLKEAEFAEFDARPVLGRVLVPARDFFLVLAYQFDESSEASASSAVDEALSSLRVVKRPRGMDGLGGAGVFAAFGLAAALALAGVNLLRA